MPSHLHEALVGMFRDRPELAAELVADPFGETVPAFHRAVAADNDFTVAPTEYRADVVVTLADAGDQPVLHIIVEVQLRRDPAKRRSWPAYVANLHARSGCRALLLVISPESATAAWCARPVDSGGPGMVLTPLVLGPGHVPMVTDPDQARRHPELAVLSALAHGRGPDPGPVLEAMLAGLGGIDQDRADLYIDIVYGVLPLAARNCLEAMMATTTPPYSSDYALRYYNRGHSEGHSEGHAEGRVDGEVSSLLTVLQARGITVSDEVRERITTCTDPELLNRWIQRATSAATAADLFT
jgi:hypothetical protein